MTDATQDPVVNELDALDVPSPVNPTPATIEPTSPVIKQEKVEEKVEKKVEETVKKTEKVEKVEKVEAVKKQEETMAVEKTAKVKKTEVKVEEKQKEEKEEKEEKKPVKKKTPTKKSDPTQEMMVKHRKMVQFVQNVLNNMEMDIKRVKLTLNQLIKFDPKNPDTLNTTQPEVDGAMGTAGLQSYKEEDVEVIEGKFDGYFMIGNDQKKYPVPLNYSSKTKLVPGDVLKLKIMDDGKFIYKLISPVERKHIRAVLSKSDENKFIAILAFVYG